MQNVVWTPCGTLQQTRNGYSCVYRPQHTTYRRCFETARVSAAVELLWLRVVMSLKSFYKHYFKVEKLPSVALISEFSPYILYMYVYLTQLLSFHVGNVEMIVVFFVSGVCFTRTSSRNTHQTSSIQGFTGG